MVAKRQKTASGSDSPGPATGTAAAGRGSVTILETEVISLFVQLSRMLGLPQSLAEIYGLLFISSRPLAMDDLIERLKLSKGSASQGLKFLRKSGAVRMAYVPGDRRVHYEALAELRNLVTRFLADSVVPQLDLSKARLDEILSLARQLPSGGKERVLARVQMLQSWHNRTRRFLPVVVKLLR